MRNNYTHFARLSSIAGLLVVSFAAVGQPIDALPSMPTAKVASVNAKTLDDLLRLDAQAAGAASGKTIKAPIKNTAPTAPKADRFDVVAIFGTGDKLKAIVSLNQDKPKAVRTGDVFGNYTIGEFAGRCITLTPGSGAKSSMPVKACYAPKQATPAANQPQGIPNALGQPTAYPPPLPLKIAPQAQGQ